MTPTRAPILDRPIPTAAELTALRNAAEHDPLLHATITLLIYTGARTTEAAELLVRDYAPGAEPALRLGASSRSGLRTIRIARTATTALDSYLAGQNTDSDEPLLLGIQNGQCIRMLHRLSAGRELWAHDLRRAAIAAALADGTPTRFVNAYFGMSKSTDVNSLVGLPDGYDTGIADALDAAFTP